MFKREPSQNRAISSYSSSSAKEYKHQLACDGEKENGLSAAECRRGVFEVLETFRV